MSATAPVATRPLVPALLADDRVAITVFSDVLCPWSTVTVLRLHEARRRLGAEDAIAFVHRAYPLELMFNCAVARRVVDAEVPLCAAAVPDFGWSVWQGRLDEYPVTSLLALEAVAAAGDQSLWAADQLDLALRRAFFVDSRCISMRSELLAIAGETVGLDADAIRDALDDGRHRASVMADFRAGSAGLVTCSGHVLLPDGSGGCAPGITTDWVGPRMPRGAPVLVADDRSAVDDVITRALRFRQALLMG